VAFVASRMTVGIRRARRECGECKCV
jgi:hypothetical protein